MVDGAQDPAIGGPQLTVCCRRCGKAESRPATVDEIPSQMEAMRAAGWTHGETGYVYCSERCRDADS